MTMTNGYQTGSYTLQAAGSKTYVAAPKNFELGTETKFSVAAGIVALGFQFNVPAATVGAGPLQQYFMQGNVDTAAFGILCAPILNAYNDGSFALSVHNAAGEIAHVAATGTSFVLVEFNAGTGKMRVVLDGVPVVLSSDAYTPTAGAIVALTGVEAGTTVAGDVGHVVAATLVTAAAGLSGKGATAGATDISGAVIP